MFTNQKVRFYLFLFLAFCVLSSKHIIIYNEETLVALSFFCFIIFVLYNFGKTISDSLNERSKGSYDELQKFLILKQNSFLELLNQHQKASGLLKAMTVSNSFTKKTITGLIQNGDKALNTMFSSRIQKKLKTLAFLNSITQLFLPSLFSETYISSLLVSLSKIEKTALKHLLADYRNKGINNAVNSFILNAQKA